MNNRFADIVEEEIKEWELINGKRKAMKWGDVWYDKTGKPMRGIK